MRKLLLISTACLIMISCQDVDPNDSIIFEKCTCDKIDFRSGIPVEDSLEQFTVNIPDSTWKPFKTIDKKYSMVIQGDSTGVGVSVISTSFSKFEPPWNQLEENRIMKIENNVIKQGKTDSLNWYIVKEDPPSTKTVFVSYVDYERNIHVTTTMMTTDSLEPKIRICELEDVLKR
ncbi:MAG: hypothetical protein U5L96_11760 [Owenweeksia sp.]|nr:hypothetical protein [Owenweeksia sp.]